MVFALQTEGESISKLEKADVLELTVKHLRKLKRQQMLAVNPSLDMDRFRAGYTQCATENSRYSPLSVRVPEQRTPKHLRMSSPSSDRGYESGRDMTPSPQGLLTISPTAVKAEPENVWRPF